MADEQFPELRIQKIEIPHVAQNPALTEKKSLLKDFIPLAIMSAAVVGLGVLGFLAYQSSKTPRDPNEIPVFKAETGPYKIKPQNPGGMEIPNTDKEVFNMIGENPEGKKPEGTAVVEPLPEEPVAKVELKSEYPAGGKAMPKEGATDAGENANTPVESPMAVTGDKTAKSPAASQGTLLPDEMDIAPPGEPNTPVVVPANTAAKEPGESKGSDKVALDKPQEIQIKGDKKDIVAKEPSAKEAGAFDENVDSMMHDSQAEAQKVETPTEEKKPAAVVVPKKAEEKKKPEAKKLALEPHKDSKKVEQAAKATPKSMQKGASKKEVVIKEKESVLPSSKADKKAAAVKATVSEKASASISGVRVQLGSFRSVKEVDAEWKRIAKRFGSDLSGMNYSAVKANLGAKGIFYRLQAGPVKNASHARAVCKNLADQGQACIVVGG
ncbi:MAG: SPOR domain-containing protein [Proteobacteria bacterium]|nr:SPOR domain-containing protein [Pseudomonadota bacterium]